MRKKYVSNRSLGGKRDSAGIGFVIIPGDQDKKQYIEHCFRTGTISIALENGGVIDNALITKAALNEVDFPQSSKTLGTQLVWVNQPRKNQPIIIGSISKTNEFSNFNKNKSALRRVTKGFVSEVIVDADKGVIIINSNSTTEGGGDIYVISTNKNKTSKLVVRVSKDIDIASENFTLENAKKLLLRIKDLDVDDEITEIIYEKGVGFSYKDEFKNEYYINDEHIQFKPNAKFKVGDGNEPAMLSETFKGIFEDLTDLISDIAKAGAAITVTPTAIGVPTSVPANAASFTQVATKLEALKKKYKKFQSGVSFLD